MSDPSPLIDELDEFFAAWPADPSFDRAVAETVARHGYARDDVEHQLRHVALRCRGRTMRLVLDDELGPGADLAAAPATVLVLASGRVPGLALEGFAAAVAIGATALVRPSRDETVLHHVAEALHARGPAALADHLEFVGGEVPWERAGSAIVFGTDETIALVRDRLPEPARHRVAGYGSRQGIAVVAPGADVDPSWAERLADDVLTFCQRGCMSPSWLFVLGSGDEADALQDAVGRELAVARDRHVAQPGLPQAAAQRRASDADVLGAIAAGLAPSSAELYAGDARLTVVRVPDEAALVEQVSMLGSLLQTAVLATAREDRARIAELLLTRTGVTRACLPGQAHEPEPLWPQDGIGRVAPLLGR
jgi:hypothetical protein